MKFVWRHNLKFAISRFLKYKAMEWTDTLMLEAHPQTFRLKSYAEVSKLCSCDDHVHGITLVHTEGKTRPDFDSALEVLRGLEGCRSTGGVLRYIQPVCGKAVWC